MRVVFGIVGLVLLAFSGFILLPTAGGALPNPLLGYVTGFVSLSAGMLYLSAAILGYRGGFRFLFGLLLIAVSLWLIAVVIGTYDSGKHPLMIPLGATALLSMVFWGGCRWLMEGHRIHQATLPAARPDTPRQYQYRQASKLHLAMQVFLCLYLLASASAMASNFMQYQLLTAFHEKAYTSREQARADAEKNDQRQAAIRMIHVPLSLATFVLFAFWTYRVCANANSFSVSPMQYRPGWAVAWYFVPFANLWHPYQAMKEIWQVSINPVEWKNIDTGLLLPAWWLAYLASNGFGWMVGMKSAVKATELAQLAKNTMMLLGCNLFALVWAVATLILLGRLARFQARQHLAIPQALGFHGLEN